MSTTFPEMFAALAAPFAAGEIKERPQSGRKIPYVTARTVMNRLDAVLGPEHWWDSYAPAGEHSVLCRLTIRLADGSTITKEDAGGSAGMADSGDDDKSAYSDAFKRAAVKFGIGRYLYGDGAPQYVVDGGRWTVDRSSGRWTVDGGRKGEEGDGTRIDAEGRGSEEKRSEAPSPSPPSTVHRPPTTTPTRVNGKPHDGPPRTGKALYSWVKDREQEYNINLFQYLSQWAKLQQFPGRMVDWNGDQVLMGYEEACRKLSAAMRSRRETEEVTV